MVGIYGNLGRNLSGRKEDEITLTFSEIEDILSYRLPPSARKFRPWWANDKNHVQANSGWLSSGWRSSEVNLVSETVKFKRVGKAGESRTELNSPLAFQELASKIMSGLFKEDLRPRRLESFPKLFDLVSEDFSIIGDAKFMSLVKGQFTPLAKFSVIAEHVWFLEKVQAKQRFLVFGNQREVPMEWLKRYGRFVTNVEFYFIDEKGHLSKLN
jgi:hypothetical protein